MHIPPLLLFVLWSCFVLSLVALAPLGYGVYRIIEDENGPAQLTCFIAGQLVVVALMTCSLALLGHSTSAIWVWRIGSAVASLFSLLLSVAITQQKTAGRISSPWGVLLVFLATAATILFFVCSLIVRALPYVGTSAIAPFSIEPAPAFPAQLSFWHAAIYVILALASIVCGLLFIVASRRDGPLSFERSGGGLGADSGGWEISNSLTYLIATIALSALLLVLLFHNDAIDQAREKRQEDAAQKIASPAALNPPAALTAQKPEAGKTATSAAE